MSAPRTWTLTVCPDCGNHLTGVSYCGHQRAGTGPTGIAFDKLVPCAVIEAEPVLDLLESLVPTETYDPSPAGLAVVEGFLREWRPQPLLLATRLVATMGCRLAGCRCEGGYVWPVARIHLAFGHAAQTCRRSCRVP